MLSKIEKIEKEIINIRRLIHKNAECGFELENTKKTVYDYLFANGIDAEYCGKAGITATIGKDGGKTLLLRCDMDALPIKEDSGLDFASKNGCMHACGHDIHTAIMLGTAKILKEYEKELGGKVVIMFQPAEEILAGAKEMLESGLLDKTNPDNAFALHILPVEEVKQKIVIPNAGEISPYADCFKFKIKGKSTHSSMPQNGIDPIVIASSIVISLQEINSRELSPYNNASITLGKLNAGNSYNVIPGEAEILGVVRSFGKDKQDFAKKRICEIAEGIAKAFRSECEVQYTSGCPAMLIDPNMREFAMKTLSDVFGNELVSDTLDGSGMGSEDFAYITHRVPSVFFSLCAKGNGYPLHHPKLVIDESGIKDGILAVTSLALNYFQ